MRHPFILGSQILRRGLRLRSPDAAAFLRVRPVEPRPEDGQ